ncbi:MAG: hypothetical protein WCI34_06440 [Actinomycetes bacterium]
MTCQVGPIGGDLMANATTESSSFSAVVPVALVGTAAIIHAAKTAGLLAAGDLW